VTDFEVEPRQNKMRTQTEHGYACLSPWLNLCFSFAFWYSAPPMTSSETIEKRPLSFPPPPNNPRVASASPPKPGLDLLRLLRPADPDRHGELGGEQSAEDHALPPLPSLAHALAFACPRTPSSALAFTCPRFKLCRRVISLAATYSPPPCYAESSQNRLTEPSSHQPTTTTTKRITKQK
jgi:hypothetical protein